MVSDRRELGVVRNNESITVDVIHANYCSIKIVDSQFLLQFLLSCVKPTIEYFYYINKKQPMLYFD